MLFEFSDELRYAIMLFVLISSLLVIKYRDIFIDSDGKAFKFGVGQNKSLIPLDLVAIGIAVGSYFLIRFISG